MHRCRELVAGFLVAATALVGAVAAGGPTVEAATVPLGFTDASVGSFSGPTAVEWLPSNYLVVLEQSGRVRIGTSDGDFTTALDLDVCSNSERGLLGFTHDPAFLTNGWVYVYYTHPGSSGCVNRVSRFTLIDRTIDPASEVVLLDSISSINGNHNGGDLDIGPDGHLYVAVGDAGRDPRGDSGSAGANDAAQDLSLLNGKILRVTLDGQPAPGNPFTGAGTARCAFRGNTSATPTTICQEIYAYGLRNPYRFAFDRDAQAGRFVINDVGQGTYEEVDEGILGANYGWPMREGACPQGDTVPCSGPAAGLTDPITFYGRSLGRSITGGAFVPDGLWPAVYDDAYLFGDFVTGEIWLMDGSGDVDYGAPFATGANGLTDMTFGFTTAGEAALFYTVFGAVRMITPPQGDPVEAPNLKFVPIDPDRAFDTGEGAGSTVGMMFNGTTRLVELSPPAGAEAALVNLTMDRTAGAGFLRTWPARVPRPATSSVNADRAGTIVANAAIVGLADGQFVIEAATTGRVVVDVMGWFVPAETATADGRFVPLEPARLADSRIPAGATLDSGSPNLWTATPSGYTVDVLGHVGVPDDGTVAAVAISLTTLSGDVIGGFVGAHPGNLAWTGTSNVNVTRFDTRANLAVVPLNGGDSIGLEAFQVEDVIVDVVGYFTSTSAPAGTSGRYVPVISYRAVDTRIPLGFGPLVADTAASTTFPDFGYSAIVHNLTVTNTSAPGHLSTHPTPTTPLVSNLNYTGPNQTRAVLAMTQLATGATERYTSLVATDLVVDVVGFFTD